MNFEEILDRMLDNVPDEIDKREGSIIYNALAPAAWELNALHDALDYQMSQCFIDTADGESLSRGCADLGIKRKLATNAILHVQLYDEDGLPEEADIDDMFELDGNTYKVTEETDDGYVLRANAGKRISGTGSLIPIDYTNASKITYRVVYYGTDEEEDDALRQRFYEMVNSVPFAGNVSDYRFRIINSIAEVGNCMVLPADTPGIINIYVLDTILQPAKPEIIRKVVEAVEIFTPIGDKPLIQPPSEYGIKIEVRISSGTSEEIRKVINEYFNDLKKEWCSSGENIKVNPSSIGYRLSQVGIVSDVVLNSDRKEIILGKEYIPSIKEVILL